MEDKTTTQVKGCSNCDYFAPEVYYSGGEQGWCIKSGALNCPHKMFDDLCESWEAKDD